MFEGHILYLRRLLTSPESPVHFCKVNPDKLGRIRRNRIDGRLEGGRAGLFSHDVLLRGHWGGIATARCGWWSAGPWLSLSGLAHERLDHRLLFGLLLKCHELGLLNAGLFLGSGKRLAQFGKGVDDGLVLL